MDKTKRKIISEYRPNILDRIVAAIFFIFWSGSALMLFSSVIFYVLDWITGEAVGISLVFGSICGWFAWRTYYFVFVNRIIITPEGIAIEGNYSTFARWEILSHIDSEIHKISNGGADRIYGIRTTKPVTNPKSQIWLGFPANFIPLSHIHEINYRVKWREFRSELALDRFAKTPLGQDLLHYAPQLFEGVNLSDEKRKIQTDNYFLFENADDYSQQQSEEKRGVYHG